MSDSRGEDADIHPYPGEDRPAGPDAEAMGVTGPGDPGLVTPDAQSAAEESTLPSEQRGA